MFRVIEFVLIVLISVLSVTEIIVPLFMGISLFPLFRNDKKVLEKELIKMNNSLDNLNLETQLVKKQRELEEKMKILHSSENVEEK